ncbi:single-stranded DNA-binding protein [Vibrio sp. 10N.222.54.A1]|uniref:Single-stranded DNA-binding protein n=2 Tax=Vibrio TaxID=662 RepID=A0A2N7CL79_VIBSP|nr:MULTISPECIES: single-stranded DNA-binding protein [Vibrio]PMF35695.1 single-stranded DNA-binding protein [Vibrio splendidus]PML86115.1 single-stranded DNA-binding protein [Vibrio sp. 10N.261.49.E11]PMN75444.1 single-stranded DNA-binding protein [Vibrio sp. 10N.261.45.A6]PMN82340.1 single-stranded DNA-binding protein [Vibrio sp. 10N.261.45.A1]TKE77121.1 single-stranded DNA-binding protein [Vibrio sp. F12]
MAKGLFIFDGNIGMTPELRWQPANDRSNGEARPLLKFNVKYDRLIKTQDPERPYEDKGGFWVDISYWGRDAEALSKLLQKGMRVRIEGELRIDVWEDKNNPGQMTSGMALTASLITIMAQRVDAVLLKKPQQSGANNNPASQSEL